MRLRESVISGKPTAEFRRLLQEGPLPVVGIWGSTAHHAQLAEATGFKMTGFPRILEMEKQYLPAETMARYEQSIGVYDPRVGHMGRVTRPAE